MIAVIGCGYWGKNLVRNFHELGALAAVCDVDRQAARDMAQEYKIPARPLAEVLGDEAIAGVAIAAPAAQHFTLAAEALKAAKHVFVEKPLALDIGHAETLCRVAREGERTLMVGHLLQYHGAFVRLKQTVRDGELGRLRYIYASRLNFGKIRREESILWSFAPHDISMILSLIGEEPESVAAVGAHYLSKSVADVTTTHLSFPGGENAHVFVSWLHPFKEQKLIVVGERAMAVFDDGESWGQKLVVFPHAIDWRNGIPEPNKADGVAVPLTPAEPLARECQQFIDCVAGAARPPTDGEEGLRVLRVLHAAERSIETGRPEPLGGARPAARHDDTMVHESAYVDAPAEIGAGTKIWHFSHVHADSRIGRNCVIGQNVAIGPDVTVGNNCKIQNNVSIYRGVTLEDDVFCGPSCVFTNVLTPRAHVERKHEFLPTHVGRGATIGANATVLCGITIGAYAMIGGGAVVTKDVRSHALMVGCPARRVGWVGESGERLGADLVCPRTGQRYREVEGGLTSIAGAA